MVELPRIKSVTASADLAGPYRLTVRWKAGGETVVDLVGWIATGGEILARLREPELFAAARVCSYGSAVEWGEEGGDLAIDAVHLKMLADEQAPMMGGALEGWQRRFNLSNTEASTMLDLGRSTFLGYKADVDAPLPRPVAIAVRASLRDPVIMQAHFRPAPPPGRRKGASRQRPEGSAR